MYKQLKLTNNKGILFGALAFISCSTAMAASLTTPNTFSAGQAISSSSMNQNFNAVETAVNDNNSNIGTNTSAIAGHSTRITSLESTSTTSTDFTGYGIPFAADGAAKNVVLLSREDPVSGNIFYFVRSRYENSSETMSIDGVATVVPYIANYVSVTTDELGALLFVSKLIEAPDTLDYQAWQNERSNYNNPTLAKTVTEDTLHDDMKCSTGHVRQCVVNRTLSATGENVQSWQNSRMRSLLGSYTVNGMTFPDVLIHERPAIDQMRLRAKGIGEILMISGGGTNASARSLIYYRVNGATGGSLAGTPFASGQPLDGLFF